MLYWATESVVSCRRGLECRPCLWRAHTAWVCVDAVSVGQMQESLVGAMGSGQQQGRDLWIMWAGKCPGSCAVLVWGRRAGRWHK